MKFCRNTRVSNYLRVKKGHSNGQWMYVSGFFFKADLLMVYVVVISNKSSGVMKLISYLSILICRSCASDFFQRPKPPILTTFDPVFVVFPVVHGKTDSKQFGPVLNTRVWPESVKEELRCFFWIHPGFNLKKKHRGVLKLKRLALPKYRPFLKVPGSIGLCWYHRFVKVEVTQLAWISKGPWETNVWELRHRYFPGGLYTLHDSIVVDLIMLTCQKSCSCPDMSGIFN